jgi:hypothetical protein
MIMDELIPTLNVSNGRYFTVHFKTLVFNFTYLNLDDSSMRLSPPTVLKANKRDALIKTLLKGLIDWILKSVEKFYMFTYWRSVTEWRVACQVASPHPAHPSLCASVCGCVYWQPSTCRKSIIARISFSL